MSGINGTTLGMTFELSDEVTNYLETSARSRGVSRTQLIRRTVELVLKDQLFLSILDDDDAPGDKTASRQGRGRPMGAVNAKRAMPPRDRLFDALTRVASAPQKHRGPVSRYYTPPASPPTKTEMQRDLQRAVLNTGGALLPTTGEE